MTTLLLIAFWLLSISIQMVLSDCTSGDLGGVTPKLDKLIMMQVPADGWTCVLDRFGQDFFAETVIEVGNCPNYTDNAFMVGPFDPPITGNHIQTYFGKATLTNKVSATISYTGAIESLVLDGRYSMVEPTNCSLMCRPI
jgi:hypothetical protein